MKRLIHSLLPKFIASRKKQSSSIFSLLSDDTLCHITTFLSYYDVLMCFRLVNKRFYDLITSNELVWLDRILLFTENNGVSVQQLIDIGKQVNIQQVALRSLSTEYEEQVMNHLYKNLQSLSVYHCDNHFIPYPFGGQITLIPRYYQNHDRIQKMNTQFPINLLHSHSFDYLTELIIRQYRMNEMDVESILNTFKLKKFSFEIDSFEHPIVNIIGGSKYGNTLKELVITRRREILPTKSPYENITVQHKLKLKSIIFERAMEFELQLLMSYCSQTLESIDSVVIIPAASNDLIMIDLPILSSITFKRCFSNRFIVHTITKAPALKSVVLLRLFSDVSETPMIPDNSIVYPRMIHSLAINYDANGILKHLFSRLSEHVETLSLLFIGDTTISDEFLSKINSIREYTGCYDTFLKLIDGGNIKQLEKLEIVTGTVDFDRIVPYLPNLKYLSLLMVHITTGQFFGKLFSTDAKFMKQIVLQNVVLTGVTKENTETTWYPMNKLHTFSINCEGIVFGRHLLLHVLSHIPVVTKVTIGIPINHVFPVIKQMQTLIPNLKNLSLRIVEAVGSEGGELTPCVLFPQCNYIALSFDFTKLSMDNILAILICAGRTDQCDKVIFNYTNYQRNNDLTVEEVRKNIKKCIKRIENISKKEKNALKILYRDIDALPYPISELISRQE
jgi:hypothetical protein